MFPSVIETIVHRSFPINCGQNFQWCLDLTQFEPDWQYVWTDSMLYLPMKTDVFQNDAYSCQQNIKEQWYRKSIIGIRGTSSTTATKIKNFPCIDIGRECLSNFKRVFVHLKFKRLSNATPDMKLCTYIDFSINI